MDRMDRLTAYMNAIVEEDMEEEESLKVLCVLQNAWGDVSLPIIFKPNPLNKSAKTIKKIVGNNVFHFCNTTPVVTSTASGIAPIDSAHFRNVIKRMHQYDIILVCGKQAEKAVNVFKSEMNFDIPIHFIPHPASRSLSNVMLKEISLKIFSLNSAHQK